MKSEAGFSLISVMISALILTTMIAALSSVFQYLAKTSVKAREQNNASTFMERFFARYNNIPYPYVFSIDS